MLIGLPSTTTGYTTTTNSYVPAQNMEQLLHLAATLKKRLTIFLLMLMVGYTTGYFHCKQYEMDCVQETEETKEKLEQKKEKKEYISFAASPSSELIVNQLFSIYLCTEKPSPVIDHLTPPPDTM